MIFRVHCQPFCCSGITQKLRGKIERLVFEIITKNFFGVAHLAGMQWRLSVCEAQVNHCKLSSYFSCAFGTTYPLARQGGLPPSPFPGLAGNL